MKGNEQSLLLVKGKVERVKRPETISPRVSDTRRQSPSNTMAPGHPGAQFIQRRQIPSNTMAWGTQDPGYPKMAGPLRTQGMEVDEL